MTEIHWLIGGAIFLCLSLLTYIVLRLRFRTIKNEEHILRSQHGTQPTPTPMTDVERLAKAGDKAEAIQRYRQGTGVDQREAKRAVDALDMGMPAAAFESAFSNPAEQLEAEVQQLLAEGRKMSAIKLYREHTGVGLREAKQAVEAMQPDTLLPHYSPDADVEARIYTLLVAGRKMDAIKLYHEHTNSGLKEAKEAVEAMEHRLSPDMLPMLTQHATAQARETEAVAGSRAQNLRYQTLS
jgi:ribosomal protein L7/L12